MANMALEITPLYAMPLAVLLFLLWLNVARRRGAAEVSIGFGQDMTLHENIRKHGNFIEFVPMVLLVMTLAELRGAGDVALHVAGILLLVSRALHPFGLHHDRAMHVMRIVGNTGSLIALFTATGAIAASYL